MGLVTDHGPYRNMVQYTCFETAAMMAVVAGFISIFAPSSPCALFDNHA
jgi:hypothetical protein